MVQSGTSDTKNDVCFAHRKEMTETTGDAFWVLVRTTLQILIQAILMRRQKASYHVFYEEVIKQHIDTTSCTPRDPSSRHCVIFSYPCPEYALESPWSNRWSIPESELYRTPTTRLKSATTHSTSVVSKYRPSHRLALGL